MTISPDTLRGFFNQMAALEGPKNGDATGMPAGTPGSGAAGEIIVALPDASYLLPAIPACPPDVDPDDWEDLWRYVWGVTLLSRKKLAVNPYDPASGGFRP